MPPSLIGLLAATVATAAASGAATASRLRVEYLTAPISIDTPLPRFSWALEHPARGQAQSAYRLVVSAAANGAVVWDSGRVESNSTLNVAYGGNALASDTDYVWTINWWDAKGQAAAPASSTFSTALLAGIADGQGATWIQPAAGSNLLRSEVVIAAPVTRARLYISGQGYYKSTINGQATDDHVMGPFVTFELRILYDAWDVTPLLREGCNALGVALGTGWYNQSTIKSGPKSLWALLSVDTADGRRTYYASSAAAAAENDGAVAATPLLFTSAAGPVVFDDLYLGETYDATLLQPGWDACGFLPARNMSAWLPAAPSRDATQNATLSAHHVQIRVDRDFPAVAVTQPASAPGAFVVDFAQNVAGILTTRVVCAAGPATVHYVFGESLNADGTVLNQYSYPDPQIMRANFTCAGTGELETYTTQFSQYGFRFVQVTGWPGVPDTAAFTSHFVHSDAAVLGALESDSAALDAVQRATVFASLSNLMDVPTDCPQRERRGWLGDAQLSAETVIHNFDAPAFYTKWLRDVADTQAFYAGAWGGAVPDCAPFYGHGGMPADPAWSAAYPLIAAWASEYYADERLVATHYPGIRAYVESQILQLNASGLLTWSRYGDWCSASDGFATPCHFQRPGIATYYFIRGVEVAADFAGRLGLPADAARYGALASATRATYNTLLLNASDAAAPVYEDGYPVSQVVAMQLGVVPPALQAPLLRTLLALFDSGAQSGVPNAPTGGIVFQKMAYPALSAAGQTARALQILLHRGFPGILNWLDDQATPATTLWENWQSSSTTPYGSYNHIMYGGFGNWLYASVAGLGRAPGSRSWTQLAIAPPPPLPASLNLTRVAASIDTAVGAAAVSWDQAPVGCGTAGASCTCAVAPENSNLTLACVGGAFSGVAFASFGTPAGACPGPFAANASCSAASSAPAVAAACVGRATCTVPVTVGFFGVDPCPLTLKRLAVAMAGPCRQTLYTLAATVPVGGTATVAMPTVAAPSAADLVVTESGAPVWAAGAFVPGVPGVTGAAAAADGSAAVVFAVGSGSYAFAAAA